MNVAARKERESVRKCGKAEMEKSKRRFAGRREKATERIRRRRRREESCGERIFES